MKRKVKLFNGIRKLYNKHRRYRKKSSWRQYMPPKPWPISLKLCDYCEKEKVGVSEYQPSGLILYVLGVKVPKNICYQCVEDIKRCHGLPSPMVSI